jgi:hypothetical protein
VNLRIELYRPSRKKIWDEFVLASKNGTFLFLRDYMDYHRDRFDDHSLMVWADDRLLTVLPASRLGNKLISHGGLTYGGFLMGDDLRLGALFEILPVVLADLRTREISTLDYKTIPHIYHAAPAEEDRYCLFRNGAVLYRTDVLTVIDYRRRLDYQERRTRSVKRAQAAGLVVRETDDYAGFWDILAANLRERYGLTPVHSVEEIRLLVSRFPEQIRLYASYEGDRMLAAAVLFLTTNVCHVQYNAGSPQGKSVGAQDILMDHLVESHSRSHRYFDFGVSTEKEGRHLSTGLVDYKEGFGGRCVVHEFFRLSLLDRNP